MAPSKTPTLPELGLLSFQMKSLEETISKGLLAHLASRPQILGCQTIPKASGLCSLLRMLCPVSALELWGGGDPKIPVCEVQALPPCCR